MRVRCTVHLHSNTCTLTIGTNTTEKNCHATNIAQKKKLENYLCAKQLISIEAFQHCLLKNKFRMCVRLCLNTLVFTVSSRTISQSIHNMKEKKIEHRRRNNHKRIKSLKFRIVEQTKFYRRYCIVFIIENNICTMRAQSRTICIDQ